jgi:hypothetical protein
MAAGTTSLVAVLRDARKSALLWTRLMSCVDIRASEPPGVLVTRSEIDRARDMAVK